MEMSIIIFVTILLIPGIWLIVVIGREFKQREFLQEQRRIEHERIASRSAFLRPASRRFAARPIVSTVEPNAPARGSAVATPAQPDEAASQDSSYADASNSSWQDLTASHVGTAFESFQDAIPTETPPDDTTTTSQVDEAFEKFLSARAK
jgi:hypothetical protein